MKNLVYTTDVQEVVMPQTQDKKVWDAYFEKLMKMDYSAPLHAVCARFSIVCDEEIELPPTPHSDLYHDTGIELCADDRFPAEEAAVRTGFFQKGVSMIVAMAAASGGQDRNLMAIVKTIFRSPTISELLPDVTVAMATALLQKEEMHPEDILWSVITHENDMADYQKNLTSELLTDPNAAAAILGYYLEIMVGRSCTIFCPLGYEPYEKIGKAMAENSVVFQAAKASGLLVEGINQHVKAALSNDGCWHCMADGVAHLLNDDELRCYIQPRERFLAEALLMEFGGREADEEEWWTAYQRYHDLLGDEWRGY